MTTSPASTRQVPGKYPTSTRQIPDKYPTSTRQIPGKLMPDNPNIIKVVNITGTKEWKIKDLMTAIGLKDRENFMNLYINPSIEKGYIRMLYPYSPRHPRQRYLLTVKGQGRYNFISKTE